MDTTSNTIEITSGNEKTEEEIQQHEQDMINLADGVSAEQPSQEVVNSEETQEKLLGKFNSQEDLLKAYQELESKLGGNESPQLPSEETENADVSNEENTDNEFEIKKQEKTDQISFDQEALTKEYLDNEGKLSDETLKNLEQIGFGKETLDVYFAGMEAMKEKSSSEVFGLVGGKDNYKEITSWASENLSDEDIDTYNQAQQSGNMSMVKMLLNGIKTQYEASVGSDFQQTPASGASGKGGSQDVYKNSGEALSAMSDPRYGNDADYTHSVEQKVIRSNVF